eukprot:6702963-Prymnesium_polylepis.1
MTRATFDTPPHDPPDRVTRPCHVAAPSFFGQIRKFLCERHQQIAQLILKMIAKRVRARGDGLIANFMQISRDLCGPTPTIEASLIA